MSVIDSIRRFLRDSDDSESSRMFECGECNNRFTNTAEPDRVDCPNCGSSDTDVLV